MPITAIPVDADDSAWHGRKNKMAISQRSVTVIGHLIIAHLFRPFDEPCLAPVRALDPAFAVQLLVGDGLLGEQYEPVPMARNHFATKYLDFVVQRVIDRLSRRDGIPGLEVPLVA